MLCINYGVSYDTEADPPPALHEVEAEVLNAVWELGEASVRQVMDVLNPAAAKPRAYTTYPGAHGTISAAGADVLAGIYGNDFSFTVTSPALPGITRAFLSFSEAARKPA